MTSLLACPGTSIPNLDGATVTTSYSYNSWITIDRYDHHYYHFTPVKSGLFIANFNADYSTRNSELRVYDGCGGNLLDEKTSNGDKSSETISVSANQTIVVDVYRSYNASMDYKIDFSYTIPVATANDDTFQTAINDPINSADPNRNVLSNDLGNGITVIETGTPDHGGSVTISPTGNITYIPDSDFTGTETFTYKIRDSDGNEDTATVSIVVAPVTTYDRDFSLRTSINERGDISVIGNTILCKSSNGKSTGSCVAPGSNEANNDFYAIYSDVDGDPATFSSTSADLVLPANSKVLWAGLYWQGYYGSATEREQARTVRFKKSGNSYQSVTASNIDYQSSGNSGPYQGFAVVTGLIDATNPNGTYFVANLRTELGKSAYGAWILSLIYQDSSATLKNMTIYDGFKAIYQSSTSQTIPVTGFKTPLTGDVESTFFIFAAEGDAAYAYEELQIRNGSGNFVNIYNNLNPWNNPFNSSTTYKDAQVTNRNPSYQNTAGIDIDTYDIKNVLGNNQTSTDIKLIGKGGDRYYCGSFGFSTQIYSPVIGDFEKNVTAAYASEKSCPAGRDIRGATLDYELKFKNTGTEAASNVLVYDDFEANGILDYFDMNKTSIPDATRISGSASGSVVCDKNATAVYCLFDRINVNTEYKIHFTTEVYNDIAVNSEIEVVNEAKARYYNASTGELISQLAVSSQSVAGALCYFTPIAEFYLDECSWKGTPGEVIESVASKNGTATGDATTNDLGVVNRFGIFDGIEDAVIIPDDDIFSPQVEQGAITVSAWINVSEYPDSSLQGRTPIVAKGDENEWEYALYLYDSGHAGFSVWNQNGSGYGEPSSNVVLSTGTWHHLVGTMKRGEFVRIYVDGVLEGETAAADLNGQNLGNGTSPLYIARRGSGNNFFKGAIDEVILYDKALSQAKIEEIYTNQSNGNNYDGTPRNSVVCPFGPLSEWRFDECKYDGTVDEVIDSSGNGRHAQTHNGVTSEDYAQIERSVYFDGVDDYVEQNDLYDLLKGTASLSFWIKTTQSGNDIPYNAPGVSGVEENGGTDDIFWGWIDRSGHICLTAKSNAHDVMSSIAINNGSWHHIVLTRDHMSGMLQIFVDGTLSGSGTHPAGEVSTAFTSFGMIEDTGNTPQYFNGYLDEVKIYAHVLSAAQIATIYTNELTQNNYDGSVRTPTNCKSEVPIQYIMDTWDIYRNINDRNISTKIAAQSFELTLASLNETNDAYQEFNGTVCSAIIDSVPKIWVKSTFEDANVTTVTYMVNNAVQNTRVEIRWWKNINAASVTCNDDSEDNSTLSTDDFAVRPEYYRLYSTGPYYAGDNFTLTARAHNALDMPAADYNESQNVSFRIEANETRPECVVAGETASMESAVFTNGATAVLDANYSGLAYDLDINIHEINGSEFAFIDRDDTNDTDRLIMEDHIGITVVPYEINITQTDINASTNANWLYMAPVDDMNVTLHVKVQANDKAHAVLPDFNATCYAQNVDVAFDVDVINGDNALDMNYSTVMGILIAGGSTLGDIDKSVQIPAANFTEGVGEGAYAFNVDRQFDTPVAPFSVQGVAAGIVSANVAKFLNNDNTKTDGTIAFYYGRLRAKDVQTTTNVTNNVEVEVYRRDDLGASGWRQNSLNWYRSEDHTGTIFGRVHGHSVEDATQLTGVSDAQVATTVADPSGGIVAFDIATTRTTPFNRVFHIDTDPWLYYVPEGFGDAYLYNAGTSDCSRHPCFNYKFMIGNTTKDISSGTFGGSDVIEKDRGVYEKKGVKVFR